MKLVIYTAAVPKSARMCYLVNCCNVYQDAICYSLSCYQTHSSWSSFKKSGYDAVERAFTKVDMENFYCVLIDLQYVNIY